MRHEYEAAGVVVEDEQDANLALWRLRTTLRGLGASLRAYDGQLRELRRLTPKLRRARRYRARRTADRALARSAVAYYEMRRVSVLSRLRENRSAALELIARLEQCAD